MLFRASFWVVGGFVLGQVIRLASNLILTRLLVPEVFGIMALVSVIVQGIGLMSDIGIGASIIQNKQGEEPEFLNTAWTIHVIRGVAMFFCIGLIAAPLAQFYDEPQLFAIVLVMAFSSLIAGFNSMAMVLANRKLWLGRVTSLNLVSQILSIVVMVAWAWYSPTIWALVAGNLIGAFMVATLSHLIFPWWRVKFHWDSQAAREIIKFGKWMLLTSTLTFFAGQLDRLTLAKLVPFDLVGIYSIGFMWAMLPLQVIQTWTGRILFPLASETFRQAKPDHTLLSVYRRRLIWLSLIGVAIFGGLITPVFRLLYTPTYWPATEFLEIILIGVFIGLIDASYRSFNLAAGQPVYTSIGTAVSIVIFAIAVFPLYNQFSAHGVAAAYSVSQLGMLAVSLYGVRKLGLTDVKVDLAAVVIGALVWSALYFASLKIM